MRPKAPELCHVYEINPGSWSYSIEYLGKSRTGSGYPSREAALAAWKQRRRELDQNGMDLPDVMEISSKEKTVPARKASAASPDPGITPEQIRALEAERDARAVAKKAEVPKPPRSTGRPKKPARGDVTAMQFIELEREQAERQPVAEAVASVVSGLRSKADRLQELAERLRSTAEAVERDFR